MNASLYKWCNCYRTPYKSIKVECFNTVEEANKRYHEYTRDRESRPESRLVKIPKLPFDLGDAYITKFVVNNAFRIPVNKDS